MKKSIYNIVQKINDRYTIIYNSLHGIVKLLTQDQLGKYEAGEYLGFSPFYVMDGVNEMQCVLDKREAYIKAQKDYIRFTIFPTLKCNANCVFCYENIYNRETMSKDVWEQTIKFIQLEAVKYKKLRIYWFGGEPMVTYPTILKVSQQLYEFCMQHGISYKASMATNLSLINDDNYSEIIEKLHIDKIEFAFDGIGGQHNATKKYNNTQFDAFNHNLNMLQKLLDKNICVLLRFNSDKSNFDGLLALYEELCERYKAYPNFKPYWAMIFPTDTYKDNPNIIHKSEYANYCLKLIRILQKNGIGMEAYPLHPSINNCYGTNPNSIVIGTDGILTKCQSSPSSKSQMIGTVWSGIQNNTNYQKWVYDNLMCECFKCQIYPICLGGCTDAFLSNSVSPCKKEKYFLQELLIDLGHYMIMHNIDEYHY